MKGEGIILKQNPIDKNLIQEPAGFITDLAHRN
jgi:hypothetical protein